MTEPRIDPDVEARVRRAFHALGDAHQPTSGHRPGDRSRGVRRRWMLVAAGILVLAGLAALIVTNRDDPGDDPVVTTPPVVVSTTTPVAVSTAAPITTADGAPALTVPDGDERIDPSTLRYPEPIPEGRAAVLTDPSLPPPQLWQSEVATTGEEQFDSVSFVAMEGAQLLLRGVAVDLPADRADLEASGRPVDIGVDGARYVDDDEGAILVPLDDGVRVIGPDDYFSFDGGGPFVDPAFLLGTASTIGTRPLDELDDVPGIFVYDGTIGGESVGPEFFVDDVVAVAYGRDTDSPRTFVTLQGLAEPPTALELLAIAQALTRGRVDAAEVGDVRFTVGSSTYLELISPVDLLIVTSPDGTTDLDAVAFVSIDELE